MPNDARDALRRYLEQRRDLGESELLLDRLSVDDVMGLLSATPVARVDLRAPADHPRLDADLAPTAADVAPPQAEPAVESSADASQLGDWRAMLRAAGAAEPTIARGATPEPAPSVDDGRASVEPQDTVAPTQQDASLAPAAELRAPSGADLPDAHTATAANAGPWAIPGVDVPTGLVAGVGPSELFGGPLDALTTLEEIARTVASCSRCPLHRTAKNAVPGEGNPAAQLVVVGEAPGAEEDATGRPFVGASGQLLTKILAAISLSRDEVFIANVVKHRPPGNRNPEPDEVSACAPYLVRQLELIRPKAILTVGNFAAQTLLGTKLGITKLRGQVHRYHGIPLVATYHPAALLRNPTWKRPTWEDVQLVRRILDRAG